MNADNATLRTLLLNEYHAVRRYGTSHDSARTVAAVAIARRFDLTRTRALAELDSALVAEHAGTELLIA